MSTIKVWAMMAALAVLTVGSFATGAAIARIAKAQRQAVTADGGATRAPDPAPRPDAAPTEEGGLRTLPSRPADADRLPERLSTREATTGTLLAARGAAMEPVAGGSGGAGDSGGSDDSGASSLGATGASGSSGADGWGLWSAEGVRGFGLEGAFGDDDEDEHEDDDEKDRYEKREHEDEKPKYNKRKHEDED